MHTQNRWILSMFLGATGNVACATDGNGGDSDGTGSTGTGDGDGDGDGDSNSNGEGSDSCPDDPDKTDPGVCGCDVPDDDSDNDGLLDCEDACPDDPDKTEEGECGCGLPDVDSDDDQVLDCADNCSDAANPDQADEDEDGVGTLCDNCAIIPNEDQADADDDGKGDMCWCDPIPLDCVDGLAGQFPCQDVDLLSQLTTVQLEGASGNDHWGWTDPVTDHQWVLMGMDNGTSFVDLYSPWCPRYVGRLPTHTDASPWRDIKILGDYAYIVSEAGGHGMQVFDLTQLRDVVVGPPVVFTETAHVADFGRAHNVFVNQDTRFAYAVDADPCNRGIRVFDLADPVAPVFSSCITEMGIAHDVQCVIYSGPDQEHVGKEICVTSDGWAATLSTFDVTDKLAPIKLATFPYDGGAYAHQGWFTDDQAYFIHDDELDEVNSGENTKSFIWDMSDLDDPLLHHVFVGPTKSSDHNQYVKGNRVYQGNYHTGLRILDISGVAQGEVSEIAFFDGFPADDAAGFTGAWSTFPWFRDGIVTLSTTDAGLFVLREP